MTKQLKNEQTGENIFPELEDGQITTDKIANESIIANKIASGTITPTKLSFALYLHRIIFDVEVSAVHYQFTFNIISNRKTAYNITTLEAYLGVNYGSNKPFGWLIDGEGDCYISSNGDLAINIYSYKGEKLLTPIELNNVSLADDFEILSYTPINTFTAL